MNFKIEKKFILPMKWKKNLLIFLVKADYDQQLAERCSIQLQLIIDKSNLPDCQIKKLSEVNKIFCTRF